MEGLKRDPVIRRAIVPVGFGGDGRSRALALLGDRLLDIALYEQLLQSGHTDEGVMTQHRSMCMSNKNLAACVQTLFVPTLLSAREFGTLSFHEKGTVLEAYVGAMYQQADYTMSDILTCHLARILKLLRANISSVSAASSEFQAEASMKKAKSTLLELLQKRGISKGTTFFTVESLGKSSVLPPFVTTFEAPFQLSHFGLRDTGPVRGQPCDSKKDADESCASEVLRIFRSAERYGDGGANSELMSVPPPPPAAEELEEGEVSRGQGDGEALVAEIREAKKRAHLKKEKRLAAYLARQTRSGRKRPRDDSPPTPLEHEGGAGHETSQSLTGTGSGAGPGAGLPRRENSVIISQAESSP